MATVIIGAGIIGTSTAYYLSRSPTTSADSIHLVESSPRLFASASGYAGGFLAKDWFSSSVVSLGVLSFELHAQLADQYGGRERWGYARSTGLSLTDSGDGPEMDGKRGEDWLFEGTSRAGVAATRESVGAKAPSWLTRQKGGKLETLSNGDTSAQMCNRGVHLHQPARVLSISTNLSSELSSIRILENDIETDIPCSRVVITAGAWTPQVFSSLFPSSQTKIPISSLAGYSLLVRSPRWTADTKMPTEEERPKECHSVFTTTTDKPGFSPEIISRLGGEIWVGGLNSSTLPLPDVVATDSSSFSNLDLESINALKTVSTRLLGLPRKQEQENDLEILRTGVCFRPVTPRGQAIITRLGDEVLGGGVRTREGKGGGLFIAAGHGPWGISLGPGTGRVLVELIEGKPTSADVRGLGL
ncbi:MAG: hypothetical protein M1834_008240 [Cirrosporium novae-zelandiae]|nr:MAG: hypothetical protein M1834_008240 [Cirrosporium novae-zelandiae]